MSSRRPVRAETIAHPRALIEAMRVCRHEALTAARPLRPFCDTFREIHLLTVAIDRLAEHLTGDPRLFHAGGSTRPSGVLNGVAVQEVRADGDEYGPE